MKKIQDSIIDLKKHNNIRNSIIIFLLILLLLVVIGLICVFVLQ